MRQNKKLDFSSEKQKNAKRLKYFLTAFAVFIVVLGTVSLLMFMRSLDFDLKNLVKTTETTTESTSETTTQVVTMTGKSTILFVCEGAEKSFDFAFIVKTDMAENSMKVCCVAPDTVSVANNTTLTFAEHFQKFSVTGLVRAVEDYSGMKIDRYIKVNETQFKAYVSKCGDVVVNVAEPINAKQSGGLSLDAGSQSLSGDLLIKYLVYADLNSKTDAASQFMKTVFSSKNISSQDSLFTYMANHSETTVSIVDYTNRKAVISEFIRNGGNISSVYSISEISGVTDEK